ncbi:MAG: SusC/RagA family TonB-linked outer membrane protein [Bacteroidota bacterium]|nr:SusC/RagA family TonB-linked outer membrane protein [Bacteroidota bacterium]
MKPNFTIFKGFTVLTLLISAAYAQVKTISGTVKSSEGEPLIGASIVVSGSNVGTTSNDNGNFALAVPTDAGNLEISLVGYLSKKVNIPVDGNVNVQLEEDVVGLEAVAVTALAIQKKERALGYSIEKVSGGDLVQSGEPNVVQAISAKTAGVQVVGSGGTPGSSSKILIRGNASFTRSNQPLIIVDGIPINNSQGNMNSSGASDYPFNAGLSGVNSSNRAIDINPDDVADITILKGPAATALYGTRAGNGVIVITTKRNNGGGIKASFSSSVEIAQVNKMPELQSEYAQGTGGGVVGGTPNYVVGNPGPDGQWFTADDLSLGTSANWGPKLSELGISATDNVDNFFKTGVTFTNNLSFSGGNEDASYRMSIGNTAVNGVIPNSEWDRTSLRINSDFKISDKLRVGGGVSYAKTDGTFVQNGSNLSGIMLGLLRTPPSFDLLGSGYGNGYELASGAQHQYFFPYDNPHWTANENTNDNQVDRLIGNINLNYEVNDWLTLNYRLGMDNYTDTRKQIFAVYSWDPPNPTGQIEEFTSKWNEIYSDLLLVGTKKLTDKLNGQFTIGNNLNQRTTQSTYSRGRNLAVEQFYNLSNASDRFAGEVNASVRLASWFGKADFDYDNWLYLGLTGRNDWASTFGADDNSFFTYSASSSIVFTDLLESKPEILDFGKLRLAYAQTGIEPAAYSTTTLFTSPTLTDGFTDGLSFPYLGVNGFGYSSTLGNANLRPERQNSIEFGLDLRFYQGRLTLDATYYNQKSMDILLFKPMAASSGFSSIYTNAGEMVNKGIELSLGGTPIKSDDFSWDINLNFTKNTNEVLKLEQGVDEINIESAFASVGSYAIVGQPYGALYGTRWKKTDAGQLIIDPTTGLPLREATRGNIGNPFPDWLMNIRNQFTYKNLNFSFLFDIREGGDIWSGTYARLNQLGRTQESADRERTYVIEGVLADANGNATTTANNVEVSAYDYFRTYKGDGPGSASENAVFDGSWLRLREVSIYYTLPFKINKLQNLTVFATGRNLWLNTDFPGVDPETSLTGSGSNVNGFDYFNNPGTKSYIFGIKANF